MTEPQEAPVRRVIQETEEPQACRCHGDTYGSPDPACPECQGTGVAWRVTGRTVQVGVPFNELAMEAYVRTLHAHIRKAAATVQQAADMLQAAGRINEGYGMAKAAQAILEPVQEM